MKKKEEPLEEEELEEEEEDLPKLPEWRPAWMLSVDAEGLPVLELTMGRFMVTVMGATRWYDTATLMNEAWDRLRTLVRMDMNFSVGDPELWRGDVLRR